MRRLPSLRRRGSRGPVEGAVWSGAVAIVHRPSSRDAAAQRRIIVPRFKRLEAERNDALHNEADALTCRPDRGPPERPAGRKDTCSPYPPLPCTNHASRGQAAYPPRGGGSSTTTHTPTVFWGNGRHPVGKRC